MKNKEKLALIVVWAVVGFLLAMFLASLWGIVQANNGERSDCGWGQTHWTPTDGYLISNGAVNIWGDGRYVRWGLSTTGYEVKRVCILANYGQRRIVMYDWDEGWYAIHDQDWGHIELVVIRANGYQGEQDGGASTK